MTKLRVFEGFAGYGGASFGLQRANIPFEVVGYSEIDKFAAELYDANHKDKHGNTIKNWGNIEPTKDNTELVRKYSVAEQFRLMDFKDGEIDFANQSYTQLSKRAANGWDVNIVGILLKHIFGQLQ